MSIDGRGVTIELAIRKVQLAELREAVVVFLKEYDNYKEVFRVSETKDSWYGGKLNWINAESKLRRLVEVKDEQ